MPEAQIVTPEAEYRQFTSQRQAEMRAEIHRIGCENLKKRLAEAELAIAREHWQNAELRATAKDLAGVIIILALMVVALVFIIGGRG